MATDFRTAPRYFIMSALPSTLGEAEANVVDLSIRGARLQVMQPFAIGAVLVALTRYVSLGSVVGATLGGILLCGLAVYTGDLAWAVWGVVLGGFIVVAHRDNIERLLAA